MLRVAAERGSTHAMAQMGYNFATGNFVARDESAAFAWSKMATLGPAPFRWGFTLLAGAYEAGLGTAKNIDEAVRLYRRAAEDGDPDAIQALQRIANNTVAPTSQIKPSLPPASQGNSKCWIYNGKKFCQ